MDIYGSKINDTVCAPATIAGTGAITLIRVSGPDAFTAADKVVSLRSGTVSGTPGGSVRFGTVLSADGSVLDEVLCNVYRAPHSYTGEDSVEIMCHASAYICTEILSLLVGAGCRMAMPGEFTQRAFLAGKMDLTQAEAVADVISASTASAHRIAMNQLRGGFSDALASLRGRLLEMASLLELELDFSEEDVEFADRKRLTGLLDETVSHISSLAASFKMGNAIKNGVPVAIVGAPNAGKSTLLNAMLGEQRAIVSDIAGTTRDTIEECINADGVLLRLVDTAGIRGLSEGNGVGEIEKIGIERSFESLRKAEIVIVLLDAVTSSVASSDYCVCPDGRGADAGVGDGDRRTFNADCMTYDAGRRTSTSLSGGTLVQILRQMDFTSQQAVFALNKCDLAGETADNIFVNLNNKIVSLANKEDIRLKDAGIKPIFVKISAKTGEGVPELLSSLADSVKARINATGTDCVTVTNARHWEALLTARNLLLQVRSGLTLGSPTDLVAEDLRSAISTLGTITGSITTTDVLENIFSKFCIGK